MQSQIPNISTRKAAQEANPMLREKEEKKQEGSASLPTVVATDVAQSQVSKNDESGQKKGKAKCKQ